MGNSRANRLRGTRRRDVIVAGEGNDVISGRGGRDLICAGAGKDRVSAGAGDDAILGGAGRDRIASPLLMHLPRIGSMQRSVERNKDGSALPLA